MKISKVYELKADEYNTQLAKILESMPEFKAPEWSLFVKTGISRQRPPVEDNYWYKRAASILRQIYIHRVVGVNRLKTRYGGKLNRGMKPERFRKASGKIIRVILQQAEAAGFLEKYNEPGKRAGRILTLKGKEFLDSIGGDKMPVVEKPVSQGPITSGEPIKSTEVQEDKEQEDKEQEDTKINKEDNIGDIK